LIPNDLQRDQDRDKLAAQHTGFFRATFMPTLASALASDRGAEARQLFIDQLADGLDKRLVEEPAPLLLFALAIVLAKGRTHERRHNSPRIVSISSKAIV
jgi:hypothetical protein